MKIAVSADERLPLIEVLLEELKQRGHEVLYFGPEHGAAARDWPDVTHKVAKCVAEGTADEGIVLCWTGTGASIAANKVSGVRAALCRDAETAKGARIWNHANVLALSMRATSGPILKEILDSWFGTSYSQDPWNLDQVAKITRMEQP